MTSYDSTMYTREAPSLLVEPESPVQQQLVAKQENPLANTHIVQTACQYCFQPSGYPGIYNLVNVAHKCEETMLAVRLKENNIMKENNIPWVRIRERKNHRDFPGNYILCNSIKYRNAAFCKYGEEVCSFAHSEEEKYLWTLEKDGTFNITEYIVQSRQQEAGKGMTLNEVIGKHGGYFEFICRSCYYGHPPQIAVQAPSKITCSGLHPHSWKDFRILAHFGNSGVIVINPRGFLHKSAFFKICRWLQFCRRMVNASCKFAHSVIERDIWMVERDTDISRDDLVAMSKQMYFGQPSVEPAPSPVQPSKPAESKPKQPPPQVRYMILLVASNYISWSHYNVC